ncbi:(4Fe-4S)-binding protein [Flavobacterium sp. NRK1]|nr:(4Fe-4S)-binding protein [Flavobacterium sp. NRK1]
MQQPVVSTIGREKYQCHVEWRNGSFVTDEPASIGGRDTGPDPYSLLLSSLASCKIVTLRQFIDKQGWDVPTIRAKANLFQVRKEDTITTTIDCDLSFPDASLEQEQHNQLLEVAENCPVSKILKGNTLVRTFIYQDEPETEGRHYANQNIAITWKPSLCKHSGRCVSQLPGVFRLGENPWINVDGASADRISEQVLRCPTGALTVVKQR